MPGITAVGGGVLGLYVADGISSVGTDNVFEFIKTLPSKRTSNGSKEVPHAGPNAPDGW
jgi:hypothetical protein